MASNSNIEKTEFELLDDVPDELECLICQEVARDPLQHEACGKLFCKQCLDKLGRDKPCPNCREQGFQYFVDHRSK